MFRFVQGSNWNMSVLFCKKMRTDLWTSLSSWWSMYDINLIDFVHSSYLTSLLCITPMLPFYVSDAMNHKML